MAQRLGVLKVSIIGAGQVGSAMALLLKRRGFRIVSVISRRLVPAKQLAAFVGCRQVSRHVADLHPETDFLLIATSDESIRQVAKEASRLPLQFDRLHAAHVSGFLTSDELRPLQRNGAEVFSFHPMQSFPPDVSPLKQVSALHGISYGVEGSPRAMVFAGLLVKRLGGRILKVPKDKKISYHLACVLASNYSVALLGAVEELAAGFRAAPCLAHFHSLVDSSIENAFRLGARKALTGPIARGSVQAVAAHTKVLRSNHRRLEPIYKALGLYALELAQNNGRISKRTELQLRKLLQL